MLHSYTFLQYISYFILVFSYFCSLPIIYKILIYKYI